MPQPKNPKPINGGLYRQALKNWYRELAEHDASDVRGHLEGLSIVVALLASRVPQAPSTAPLQDERFRLKRDRWLECLRDLLTTGGRS